MAGQHNAEHHAVHAVTERNVGKTLSHLFRHFGPDVIQHSATGVFIPPADRLSLQINAGNLHNYITKLMTPPTDSKRTSIRQAQFKACLANALIHAIDKKRLYGLEEDPGKKDDLLREAQQAFKGLKVLITEAKSIGIEIPTLSSGHTLANYVNNQYSEISSTAPDPLREYRRNLLNGKSTGSDSLTNHSHTSNLSDQQKIAEAIKIYRYMLNNPNPANADDKTYLEQTYPDIVSDLQAKHDGAEKAKGITAALSEAITATTAATTHGNIAGNLLHAFAHIFNAPAATDKLIAFCQQHTEIIDAMIPESQVASSEEATADKKENGTDMVAYTDSKLEEQLVKAIAQVTFKIHQLSQAGNDMKVTSPQPNEGGKTKQDDADSAELHQYEQTLKELTDLYQKIGTLLHIKDKRDNAAQIRVLSAYRPRVPSINTETTEEAKKGTIAKAISSAISDPYAQASKTCKYLQLSSAVMLYNKHHAESKSTNANKIQAFKRIIHMASLTRNLSVSTTKSMQIMVNTLFNKLDAGGPLTTPFMKDLAAHLSDHVRDNNLKALLVNAASGQEIPRHGAIAVNDHPRGTQLFDKAKCLEALRKITQEHRNKPSESALAGNWSRQVDLWKQEDHSQNGPENDAP